MTLTPRESNIVECLCEGCTNKDIANTLDISEDTVKRHLQNISDKTGRGSRLEIAVWALDVKHSKEIEQLKASYKKDHLYFYGT